MQNPEIDIRRYEGQKRASFKVGNLQREGRVDQVEQELWIVGNDQKGIGNDGRRVMAL
jgi:hypothetical protein